MAATENIQTVLRKFEVDATDLSLLKKAGELLIPEMAGFVQDWYSWLQMQEEYQYFFAGNAEALGRVQRQQLEHWRSFFSGEMDERFAESRRYIGAVHARIDLPNDIYLAGVSKAVSLLGDRLGKLAPQDAVAMVTALRKCAYVETYYVLDEISRIQREKIAQHSRAVMEVSTPVTPIWEGILLLPLLGIIDSARTQDIMNKSLSKIAELRAKVFVLDISGVGALDTAVANQLIKITKATRLMGCEAIISGISPAIARTVVELGVNVGEVKTTATLRDAFEIALRLVGADKRVHALAEGGV
jgi:rsbT co-antagonist protein RsbR